MIREAAGRDWRAAAVCAAAGTDPELFYPIDTGPAGELALARAKRVCAGCPVRAQCLADAMALEDPAERWGVIGGLSAPDRTALHLNEHRPTPAPVPAGVLVLTPGVQLDLFDLPAPGLGVEWAGVA